MKERPILFSSPMVRAILDGSKTQTRRVVKYHPLLGEPTAWCAAAKVQEPGWVHIVGDYRRFCPYGIPGDRLWVRETWAHWSDGLGPSDESSHILYRADTARPDPKRWRPSIFMPRDASRILLEITDVRVQRLQEISTRDIWAEGVAASPDVDPFHEWRELWGAINGADSWAANPWVWAITFRRLAP